MEIVNSTSAKAMTPKLERIFATHEIPYIIKSDNGPPSSGHDFYTFLKNVGAHHKLNIPLSPQVNGLAESFMKPLLKAICIAVTGKSPAELLYNR